jgi:hypothetical protein
MRAQPYHADTTGVFTVVLRLVAMHCLMPERTAAFVNLGPSRAALVLSEAS